MNETGLLLDLALLNNNIGFANADAIQPPDSDPQTAESNLCKWINESSGTILNDVIPERFWSEHNLSKPSKVSQLCPCDTNDSVVVLLVVLWSCCSPKCYEEITVCLKYGAMNWQTDDMFKPIDWLRAYVKSIWVCLLYSRREIRDKAEKENASDIAKRTILLDAYALNQAVSNSSEWFGILTSKQVPTLIFKLFANKYVRGRKLKAKFMGSVRNLSVFSDIDRKVVMHVSIATWFKTTVIIPQLVDMMILVPMAELAKEIKILRYTNDESRQRMATYRKVSEEAAQKLGLDLSDKENAVADRLAVFAQLAQQMIEKKTKPSIIDDENLMLQIICPALVDAIVTRKRGIVLLKEMMTKKPPLFPDDFVKAVTNSTCHLIPIDNAKENIPNSTEGVPLTDSSASNSKSPKTKSLKKWPTKNLSTKKAPTKKASTKKTTTVVEGGGGTQTSNITSAVKSVKKSSPEENGASRAAASKKRKNKSSQGMRKSLRTKDGKSERTSEEDEVGKEEKKVTQTQHNNKPEEDEEDIQPKRGSSHTPLFQLDNQPKTSSPYKTPLIGYTRKNNITRHRTTSGEDKQGIQTKKGSESKTELIEDSDSQHSGTAKVFNRLKHRSSDSSNLTGNKPNVLPSDTSKVHDHKGDKEQTPVMKRLCSLLEYFSENGEINSERERWARCEHISETHSQSFGTVKMKGRKNIVQDLVVLNLALIRVDKMIRVDKIGQTPKETNEPEKEIFDDIEKSMESFDGDDCDIGRMLSHLIVSSKLLQSKSFIRESIQRGYLQELGPP